VVIKNPNRVCKGVALIKLDGAVLLAGPVALMDDKVTHLVEVTLRAARDAADSVARAA